jgi:uncharacterized membrane protein YedE/YeeE
MTGIETSFTPFQSLAGGALIGVASVLLMALLGRIMGATGLVAGLLLPSSASDWNWRAALLAGMVSAPVLILFVTGAPVTVDVPVSTVALVVGGMLVGYGASTGSGCTSGHGVCGMARLSPRSIVATLTFMATTFVTVFIVRHVIGG